MPSGLVGMREGEGAQGSIMSSWPWAAGEQDEGQALHQSELVLVPGTALFPTEHCQGQRVLNKEECLQKGSVSSRVSQQNEGRTENVVELERWLSG